MKDNQKTIADLRIIFMGTPEFAVASLDALVQAGAQIAAVVTAPDKPAGRGMKLQESAVKKYAEEKGLMILQPPKLKDPAFIDTLQSLHADIQVVVAFRMLPEIVWNMPPMGTLNVHGSLLPRYRGAAPINWAIINGDKETGVTTFRLRHEIDTGDILLQEKMNIGENETAGTLHDRMKTVGAKLLVRTLEGLASGNITEQPQDKISGAQEAPHAPKIFTETGRIHWEKPAGQVQNLIRGLSPYPGAYTFLDGKMLKIYQSEKLPGNAKEPGSHETDGKTYLKFSAADGWILVKELQLEGKKRMLVEDFLRGYRFT